MTTTPSTRSRPRTGRLPLDSLTDLGDLAVFCVRALRELPDVRQYGRGVMHQAAVLVLSSGVIIWAMQGVIGTMCGTEASDSPRQIRAPLYSGAFNAWCGPRELAPLMWGYIFAAKVGCGLVAEIGSMRIAEEIDALEVMGARSRVYLIGTRMVAAWLAIPLLFTVGVTVMFRQ